MRVVVDVSPLSHPRTGIGNYLRGLVGSLARTSDVQVVAFGPIRPGGRKHVLAALNGAPVERRLPVVPKAQAWRTAWSRLGWPPVERIAGPLDVFHFSDWMFPPQRGGLRATTIYDLVPLRFPGWVAPRTLRMHTAKYEHAARACDLIVCISHYTAADVGERLGVPEERLCIAYPGIDPAFRADGDREERPNPYVLAVSTLEPRKNLGVLVDAFRRLRSERPELRLVVAGANGHEAPQLAAEGVELVGFVDDVRLARLYRGASAFAYPSRFEGFGMPVVEAMASATPVAASSHPSLDEACGEAAFRADPDDPDEFAGALVQALDADADVASRGAKHASGFTWEACGLAVLDGYRRRIAA